MPIRPPLNLGIPPPHALISFEASSQCHYKTRYLQENKRQFKKPVTPALTTCARLGRRNPIEHCLFTPALCKLATLHYCKNIPILFGNTSWLAAAGVPAVQKDNTGRGPLTPDGAGGRAGRPPTLNGPGSSLLMAPRIPRQRA